MSALSGHVGDYLRLRRALGFKLKRPGEELPQFVVFLDAAGAQTITIEIAIAWAQLSEGAQPITLAKRLGAVRGFARYLATIDPATEIPPTGIFGARHHRPAPYLYSNLDVRRLLAATRGLRPSFRAATYETLFGLLASSGLRVGEAIALTRADVELTDGIVTIRHAKFDRSRLVPLHPSVTDALRAYATCRDRLCPTPTSDTFFLASIGGKALTYKGVHYAFTQLSTAAGLRTEASTPLIHGLRHILSALCACSDSPGKRTYRPSPPTQFPPRCRFSSPKRTLSSCTRLDRDKMQHEHHRTRRVRKEEGALR